jgi:carbonic anhydrase/acetyltransferase-like protein (isoleucine patch superfamily)
MDIQERLDNHLSIEPKIADSAYVAESAVVIGDVELAEDSSVWPTAVLRGDIEKIRIGKGSNIQDGSIVHLADDLAAIVGENVTVGHGAIIHACTIGDECLIGMRATVMDGAEIGAQSIVGAHSLVTKGFKAPSGSLIMGTPAKIVKSLDQETRDGLKNWALKYVKVAASHKMKFSSNS